MLGLLKAQWNFSSFYYQSPSICYWVACKGISNKSSGKWCQESIQVLQNRFNFPSKEKERNTACGTESNRRAWSPDYCASMQRASKGLFKMDITLIGKQVCRVAVYRNPIAYVREPCFKKTQLKPHLKSYWCIPPKQNDWVGKIKWLIDYPVIL